MSHCCNIGPDDGSRIWHAPDGVHIDVRGLAPPEPMIAILRLIDDGDVGQIYAHFDREPIFLYPELNDRGWAYEVLPFACDDPDCENEVRLQLTRLSA